MSAPKTKLPKIVRNILYSSIAFVVLLLLVTFLINQNKHQNQLLLIPLLHLPL